MSNGSGPSVLTNTGALSSAGNTARLRHPNHRRSLNHRHDKKKQLIPRLNFFAETLRETLDESSLSQAEIARRCGIPAPHLTQMKQGKRRYTPEYDLRLSAFFGITPGVWINLQLDDEFIRTDREKGEVIRKEVQPCAA